MFLLCPGPAAEWINLPSQPTIQHTKPRLHICVACKLPGTPKCPLLRCCYFTTGFPFSKGTHAVACGTAYHSTCIQAGAPFTSRTGTTSGLTFPKVTFWPNFTCELCTVRSVLNRELGIRPDLILLCLERMRIIDIAHYWSKNTHKRYQGFLRAADHFQARYPGVPLLDHSPPPLRPHFGPDIPLQWMEEEYTLRPGKEGNITYSTVRGLRSAVAFHEGLRHLNAGDSLYFDRSHRLLSHSGRYTDGASSTLFARGLSTRLGTESRPSHALLERHILWMDNYFLDRFRQATSPADRVHWSTAGLANVTFWLGWLRSRECFDLRWVDIKVTTPADGPSVDLPPGIGAVFLRLANETKSSRSRRADVVVAYTSKSGLSFGRWHRRAAQAHRVVNSDADHRFIFSDADGTRWTSRSYRERFLYPCLLAQQAAGDAQLRAFDGRTKGNDIPSKYWSMNSYRRGGRSHVTKLLRGIRRQATLDQVYEHGRWR